MPAHTPIIHTHTHRFFSPSLSSFHFFTSSFLLSQSIPFSVIVSYPEKDPVLLIWLLPVSFSLYVPSFLYFLSFSDSHTVRIAHYINLHRLDHKPAGAVLLLIFQQADTSWMCVKLFSSFSWPCTSLLFGSSIFCKRQGSSTHFVNVVPFSYCNLRFVTLYKLMFIYTVSPRV